MDSYFSSRDRSPRSQADALPSGVFCPSPLNLCDVVLHDRYRILKPLGEGGFGKTFLALDEQAPSSFCVVKRLLLSDQVNHHPQASALFQQEAQRLAVLGEHPQLPQLLDAFEQNGQAFTVQEWVDGWTLEQEVAGTLPFDEMEIWQLLLELLPVLQFLHDHQIIHCDIKPANVIRRRHISGRSQPQTQRLVLVDFGAAKQASDAGIFTDTAIGSAEYAAPEQIRGQAVFASDLYSLGVTCIHLLTQASPFDFYDMSDATWKWQAYLTQPISPHLKQVLCTLIQPAIRRRYQSAAEVLAAIQASGTQANEPFRQFSHQPSTWLDVAIAPTAFALQQTAETDCSTAAIAAINAARMSQSIAAATVYSPQEQRWYYVPPQTETVASDTVALCPESHLTDATTTAHAWEQRLPIVSNPVQGRHLLGWHLLTVGVSTAVVSVAVTCLWLCVSIIFLALVVPPHSSATPSQANPSAASR